MTPSEHQEVMETIQWGIGMNLAKEVSIGDAVRWSEWTGAEYAGTVVHVYGNERALVRVSEDEDDVRYISVRLADIQEVA